MSLDALGTELGFMEGMTAYQLSRYHADCCEALQDLWQPATGGFRGSRAHSSRRAS